MKSPMVPESHESESNRQPVWSEPRVERLLGWYFAQELPPELRQDTVRGQSPLPRRTARSADRWLLPWCAAALIGCVWIMQQLPPQMLPVLTSSPPVREVELEATSLPVNTELASYAGSRASYRQRSELRWTSESYFEPYAGVWVEWSAPELVIEVETVTEDHAN